MRRSMLLSIKLAISAFLIYLSLRKTDLAVVNHRLSGIDLFWTSIALIAIFIQAIFLSMRWWEIAVACGAKLSKTLSLRYLLISQFFSQVLPSTIGGDAIRVWLLAQSATGWSPATYSVLIDRFFGISTLIVLVAAAAPWTFHLIQISQTLALTVIGLTFLACTSVFLFRRHRFASAMKSWWLTRHLAELLSITWKLSISNAGMRSIVLSFASHLAAVVAAWAAAMGIHAMVTFVDVFILVLPALLISMIPISIAGWGVRESAMVAAFSYAGLSGADGLLISVLIGLANLVVGIVGGLIWISKHDTLNFLSASGRRVLSESESLHSNSVD